MKMNYELVQSEFSDQTYPITDMKVGDWAVIVRAKSTHCAFDSALFGHAVQRLHGDISCVCTDKELLEITETNYLVRDFNRGEYVKIRRA